MACACSAGDRSPLATLIRSPVWRSNSYFRRVRAISFARRKDEDMASAPDTLYGCVKDKSIHPRVHNQVAKGAQR